MAKETATRQGNPSGVLETPARQAAGEFLHRVSAIPGVIDVHEHSGREVGDLDISVTVHNLRGEPARRIYTLEAELRKKYKGSKFLVRLREQAANGSVAPAEPV